MSQPTYREMIEDVCAWGRAGYPAVAIGRYQDAAERIRQLERLVTTAMDLQRDALRYRWVRVHACGPVETWSTHASPESFDRVIDLEIAKESGA